MGKLSAIRPTLLDVARALDPNGNIATVAEILQEYNEILDDIPWMEGNLPTGHQITIRTSKPTPTFRLLNEGVVPAKATTGQVTEACAILENRNEIDKDVANLNGNTKAFRFSQDKAMIEGFSDQLADTLIYGDSSVNEARFNGLATRYFSLGTTYPEASTYMIDAGGTGSDNTSIWLVGWGDNTISGIYPKGSKAGLDYQDLGLQDVLTNATTGAKMRAYASWMQWKCGLAVMDRRYVIRICNIDVSALKTASDTSDSSANILKYMSMALDTIPAGGSVKRAFYMNNVCRQMLRAKLMAKSNFALTLDNIVGPAGIGRQQLAFFGVPVRRVDSILSTEARISTATT